MKNTFKTAVVAFAMLLTSMSFAQSGNGNGNGNGYGNATETSSTNLTVNVAQLYSIIVEPNATINLTTQNDFENGAKSGKSNMKVFASNGYKITAQASAEKFATNKANVTSTPNVNNVDVLLSRKGNSAVFAQTSLNHSGSTLHTSTSGENHTNFDVEYSIPSTNTDAFLTSGGQTLTTVVTYTITSN